MQGFAQRVAGALVFAALSQTAAAAPCAGFTDVDSAHALCPNVEWIRNRSITTGCATGAYCPADPVSRLQMAAFMQRLGAALTPQPLIAETTFGAVTLGNAPVVCSTSPFVVAGFPRRAVVDLALAAQAATSLDVGALPVVSFDAGANWAPIATLAGRASVTAGQWGHVSSIAVRDVDVGQTVRFGLRVSRLAGAGDLTGGSCQVRVQVVSRDGAASPY